MSETSSIFDQSLVILYPCFSAWVLMLFYQVFTGHIPGWGWQRSLFALHLLTMLGALIVLFSGFPLSGRLLAYGYVTLVLFVLSIPILLSFAIYCLLKKKTLAERPTLFRIRDYSPALICLAITLIALVLSTIAP